MLRRAFLRTLGAVGVFALPAPSRATGLATRMRVNGEWLCFDLDEPVTIHNSLIEIEETVRHRAQLTITGCEIFVRCEGPAFSFDRCSEPGAGDVTLLDNRIRPARPGATFL